MLGARRAVAVFLVFAFAYFFSALLRAITATLAPIFSHELGLDAAQLGLLAGAYFLGFSATQLPLGRLLDRHGPKRVIIGLLFVAVAGCAAFAAARGIGQLLAARLVIGMGVSACLMAPLTLFRHRFDVPSQLRANSWMLMTGSIGMLASTVPVQWLLPLVGWRGLFAAAATTLLAAIALIALVVPSEAPARHADETPSQGYSAVFRSATFQRLAPAAFFSYGGLIALQSLWIGPWLTEVAQLSPGGAAGGLFVVNASMLFAFLGWGLAMPRLTRSGWSAERLISIGWPLGVVWLAVILWLGRGAGAWPWALWCVLTSVVTLSQPAVAQAFPASLAGRALTAFNLAIFLGVFSVQWGLGLLIDALKGGGWSTAEAYRLAFAAYLCAAVLSFAPLWRRAGPIEQR